ncbi:hypothetical protein RJ640_027170 [Escallonia rubra]|uniref:Uncharacterized protein n=1 Tax=Escallonia rubra TaxID=112253 RepID=A0AA88US56_9ASTE|nr:hypothetical protein RJ640_027170 [Escallonia rubra]
MEGIEVVYGGTTGWAAVLLMCLDCGRVGSGSGIRRWWKDEEGLEWCMRSREEWREGKRVAQAKCQAAYFILVLHHLKSVVIAVRGTETPEDLITDGLPNKFAMLPILIYR